MVSWVSSCTRCLRVGTNQSRGVSLSSNIACKGAILRSSQVSTLSGSSFKLTGTWVILLNICLVLWSDTILLLGTINSEQRRTSYYTNIRKSLRLAGSLSILNVSSEILGQDCIRDRHMQIFNLGSSSYKVSCG